MAQTVRHKEPDVVRHGDLSGAGCSSTKPDDDGRLDGSATPLIGEPFDWVQHRAMFGEHGDVVVFNRVVEYDNENNKVVTITADCDPPDMLLLARKGDIDYWSGDNWLDDDGVRCWCVDIAVNMLRDGLVATYPTSWDSYGIECVLQAPLTHVLPKQRGGPHILSEQVALVRALRLIQSMTAGTSRHWETWLTARRLPREAPKLLTDIADRILCEYDLLPQPPWQDGVPWGPQPVAGNATTKTGNGMFVGEQSDLIWRALTESDYYGRSPLKAALMARRWEPKLDGSKVAGELITAAALYDQQAACQLTHGLFDGCSDVEQRRELKVNGLEVLGHALNPTDGDSRWDEEQQDRLCGFIDIIEALNP